MQRLLVLPSLLLALLIASPISGQPPGSADLDAVAIKEMCTQWENYPNCSEVTGANVCSYAPLVGGSCNGYPGRVSSLNVSAFTFKSLPTTP